jgi:4-hydroxy-tetrahydrodipicolinate reductase
MTVAVPPVRLAVIGVGKMGRAVAELAPERGFEVVATVERTTPKGVTPDTLGGADVAVEFTEPGATVGNVTACVAAGCPVVVGTTGWYDQFDVVADEVRVQGGAMLWAANFSVGVNLFVEIVARAGELLAGEPFDAHLVETHHAAKKDAPSGTALLLARRVEQGLGRALPVTSVRTGAVPGTHELIFDAPFEQIRLVHAARDRRVFADGALLAARWLVGRRGVYTLADVLRGGSQTREEG